VSGTSAGGRQKAKKAKDGGGTKRQGRSGGLAWKLWTVVGGVIGIGILSIYVLMPTITVSSLQSPSPNRARVSVGNSGRVPISDIHVECRGNKAVFGQTATLALNGYSAISEFSVPRVAAGEGFVSECPQPWSFYIAEHDGFFAYGDMQPDLPPFIIDFSIDGKDIVPLHRTGAPQRRFIDTSRYSGRPLTGIDASLTLSYKLPWFLFGWHSSRDIHLIAEDRGSGLIWRVAADGEPPLPDSPDGFVMETRGKTVSVRNGARSRP
jgi:hypothetical protein